MSDVSLQEGKFILNDICLDSDYITKAALQAKCPGLFIVKAQVDRLEISLMLKETSAQEEHETGTDVTEGGFNRCVDLPDWQVDINHMGTVDCGNT
jgi:hypothetical protein